MLMRYGFMGVDVFFFISGVVITRSAVGRHPRDFVVARFARLAPAYLLILGATIVVDILASDPRLTFESALSSLTFSEYVTGTESGGLLILDSWTLWVEIQFYLLIALFLLAGLLLPRKSKRRSFPSLSQLRVVYLVWLALLAMALANVQEIPGLLTLAGYASIFLCGALFGTVVSWRDALRMSPILLLATTMMLFRFLERASGAAIEPTDFGGALPPRLSESGWCSSALRQPSGASRPGRCPCDSRRCSPCARSPPTRSTSCTRSSAIALSSGCRAPADSPRHWR